MARKRGGLAGLYDRNKDIIQTAAKDRNRVGDTPIMKHDIGWVIRGGNDDLV